MEETMRHYTHIVSIAALILLYHTIGTSASIDVTITPDVSTLGPFVYFADTERYENEIENHPQSFISINEKTLPYGFALANTLGYPNGKSIMKPFPAFEAGIAGGTAVYKYKRYKDFDKNNPSIPGIGANAAIHAGTGIDAKSDITFKLMFSQNFYRPKNTIDQNNDSRDYEMKVKKVNILSLGSKLRYNIIPARTIVPAAFSFSGITGGVAIDYTGGQIEAQGLYRDRRNVDFTVTDPITFATINRNILVESTITGKTALEWNIVSITPELYAYIDLLYLFSLYTGPSVSLNAGSVKIKVNADGNARNINTIYSDGNITELIPANSTIATAKMESNTRMKVPWAIPKWTLGLELNIFAFKLQVEGTTVLTSPLDSYAVQAGARIQL